MFKSDEQYPSKRKDPSTLNYNNVEVECFNLLSDNISTIPDKFR